MKTLLKLANQRVSLKVLNNVRVTDSEISATDLDTRITIPNSAGIMPGFYHGKGFESDNVRTINPDVNAENYPVDFMKLADYIGAISFDSDAWARMQWVMLAMSDDATRFYLNGVCFYPGAAIATDGHRLHKMQIDTRFDLPEKGLIVPRQAMAYIDLLVKEYKAAPEFDFMAHGVSVRVGPAILESRYIDGTFPDCERVIPQEGISAGKFTPENIKKGMKDLKAAAKIAGSESVYVVCNGTGKATSLVNDKLAYDIGVTFVNADSECFEIGFQANYLADLPRGEIVYNGATDPIRVNTDDGRTAVCMPVRLANLR